MAFSSGFHENQSGEVRTDVTDKFIAWRGIELLSGDWSNCLHDLCYYLPFLASSFHVIISRYLNARVNVHNLAQVANWRSLVKTSLEMQSSPLFQINRLDQNPLGLLPLVKSINLKVGTQLQLPDCANLQPAPNCAHLP
jgi:hypothetical protein